MTRILVIGAGAVGTTIAGCLAQRDEAVLIHGRPADMEAIERDGVEVRLRTSAPTIRSFPRVVRRLHDAKDADVVILAVKNYDLEIAAMDIVREMGHDLTVVPVQNGVHHMDVLPAHFENIVYAVICFSALKKGPGMVEAENRGPIVLGTKGKKGKKRTALLAELFMKGIATDVTDDIVGAVHNKLAVSTLNAVMTLIGLHYREIEDITTVRKLSVGTMLEAIEVIERAGHREVKLENIPDWKTLRRFARMPGIMADPLYRKRLYKLTINSLAQDVLQRKRKKNELRYINGRIVSMAKRMDMETPFNSVINRLGKKVFGPEFEPMTAKRLMGIIKRSAGGEI